MQIRRGKKKGKKTASKYNYIYAKNLKMEFKQLLNLH